MQGFPFMMNRTAWVRLGLFLVALAVAGALWFRAFQEQGDSAVVPYSALLAAVDDGKVSEVLLENDRLVAKLKEKTDKGNEKALVASRLPNIDERELVARLEGKGVAFSGRIERSSFWPAVLSSIFPIVMLIFLFRAMGGLMGGEGAGRGARPMSFGKSQAKIFDRSSENRTTFADVAGVDESKNELIEVVNYLKDPDKYRAIGARVPKGVLLVGAPGTGKTLLARAVAGESGVPFFSMSGSEFVEMFVGVGASRVRDLFTQAKERAPCIVFIDELDAVGKTRAGGGVFAANEEREQTLNQLLVEMDGFDASVGIVIMQHQRPAHHPEERPRRAGAHRVVADDARRGARDAAEQVHHREARRADGPLERLAPREAGPQVPHQVHHPDVQEHRSAQPPPLAFPHCAPPGRPEAQQRLGAGGRAGALREEEDDQARREEEGGRRHRQQPPQPRQSGGRRGRARRFGPEDHGGPVPQHALLRRGEVRCWRRG
jgi:shikimate kinase